MSVWFVENENNSVDLIYNFELGDIAKNAKFIKITKAGFYESMVHSVEMTQKSINYKLWF